MQPPPRKGNYVKFLKNLHSEQIAKLALKNQHECDLLEDIRSFTIKRSAIEKSYSEALLKISSAYLNKKIPNIPDIKLEGGEEKWNMWNVWRTVLEENEKLARARLAAVEVFQQQIADDAKILRAQKLAAARKCVEQLALVQKELQACIQDVDKTKKLYFDEEHSAHDVRDKARDIEEKLKKKKGSFFQSITSLQKNSAKVSSKREQLEEKSTGARNDYLLCLAAANAHQTRYFLVDLQMAMTTMENGVYEKVAEYLMLMGRTELLTCSAMQNSFGTIRDQAKQLTREYNLQCCYLYYPVLKQHIQYDFEACDNDPVAVVTADHESAAATLSKEARRLANKIARENNNVKECFRKLQNYSVMRESGQKTDPSDPNGPDLETKIEEMKLNIRRSETAKMKAEARIETLRAGGVNVDEWLQEAETLNVQDIQRSTSSLSMRTDASGTGDHANSDPFYDSDFADEQTSMPLERMDHEDSQKDDSQEVDAMLEQERQRIEQLTADWEDPTQVDWGTDDASQTEGMARERTPSEPVIKCTALYSYTAQNPDELTIVESEQLEVIGEGDGDGWLRARNYRGEEGYVPHNYLDVETEHMTTTPGLVTQISFSSVDYTVDNEEETNQSPEQASVIAALPQEPAIEALSYCCALYDYDGEGDEELTFEEGQVIKVLSKQPHGVDDGWWQGEVEGRIGNFPSLVVEECDEYGEPLTNQWNETPPCSAPPVFTPPEVPEFLREDDGVPEEISPVEESQIVVNKQPEPEDPPIVIETTNMGFSMELSRDQQEQYGSQFQPNSVPTIDVRHVNEVGEETAADDSSGEFGLGVAQIVITAATPMMEDGDHSFPASEEAPTNHATEEEQSKVNSEAPIEDDVGKDHVPQQQQQPIDVVPEEYIIPKSISQQDSDTIISEDIEEKSAIDDQPDSIQYPVSSSTEGDGETTGPSTAENSISNVPPLDDTEPKLVVGGRASIPDELEPHQLARLQDLKESNA